MAMETRSSSVRTPSPVRALSWLRDHENPSGGISSPHSGSTQSDPALTGALIPTLIRNGESEFAVRCAQWLLRIQLADGSYPVRDSQPSALVETVGVLGGLLAVRELLPSAAGAAKRAAEYIYQQVLKKTNVGALWALYDAGSVLENPDYRALAESCLKNYRPQYNSPVQASTDLLGDESDALIHLDQPGLIRQLLLQLGERQRQDGAVSATSGGSWVSSAGLAHLALCWQQIGQHENAVKALAWLEKHQQASGGFKEGYGWSAPFRARRENAWTIKWYLDAHYFRMVWFMEREVGSAHIALEDGRVQALMPLIRPNDRVIEVGCGKGRYLTAIRRVYPEVECTGVDIVAALLAAIPAEIKTMEGSLESVPCPDNSFDVVFSVEALEHSPNFEAAISELSRITRPGGWLAIIDKERGKWGRFECPSWEHWPVAEDLALLFNQYCEDVCYEPVGYDGHPADGLMMIWKGRKRS